MGKKLFDNDLFGGANFRRRERKRGEGGSEVMQFFPFSFRNVNNACDVNFELANTSILVVQERG